MVLLEPQRRPKHDGRNGRIGSPRFCGDPGIAVDRAVWRWQERFAVEEELKQSEVIRVAVADYLKRKRAL
jgi:hypothetical protein